jgi:multidrug resistance efflux pump
LEHNAIFLMPLWKAIGKVMSAFQGGNLFKTLFAAGIAVAAVLCLCWIPWPFSLAAKGALIPEVQSEVYAQSAGVMEELFVSDQGDTEVQQGQVLARMSNNDLAVAIENLRNSIVEAETRQAINESLRSQDELSEYERQTIEIEIEQARQEKFGLRKELELRLIENAHLEVVAPGTGTVVNWQARQNLINRPVERGQNLMTIVDPNSNWLLELELPERRLGHLMDALTKSGEPLQVTFAMVSMPSKEFEGRLHLVDHQLDVHSDQGNTCLVRVAFDNRDLDRDLLRTGTRVNASIACGTRSIGYAMFHEVIETVQSKWMLWF